MLVASSGFGAFVEQFYLRANPDVAEAVAKGAFSSGLDHWLLHGRQEGRSVWTKADITNYLADVRSYRSYLEICTPTTGGRYAEVDRSKYETCHRLMYRCPEYYDDKSNIDFRSPDFEIADCIRQIGDLRYDVILVDAFHAYGTSLRDLRLAADLLTDGGTVVVHDCDPPNEEVASPHFNSTAWAGVTYKAYLDFVTQRDDLVYFTVDTDWGCGVIRRRTAINERTDRSNCNKLALWRKLGDDFQAAFRFLQANKVSLLRLITVEEFLHDERIAQLINVIALRDEELKQIRHRLESQITEHSGIRQQLEGQIANLEARVAESNRTLNDLSMQLSTMKRSRLLKIGRMLRRLTGQAIPY